MSKLLKFIGPLLILVGLSILFFIYFPVLKQELNYQVKKNIKNENEVKEIKPVDEDFGLVIAKIDVNTKVFKDVDSNNPKEYLPLLTKGVAHAKGSVLPGESGNVFIFAHSTDTSFNASRYNAVFYLLNKLEKDDEIIVYYNQEKYLYKVTTSKILSPDRLDDYLKTLSGSNLILQTCTPPGTTINRLLLIAKEMD